MKPCTLKGSNPAVTKSSVWTNMIFTINDKCVLRNTVFIWNLLVVFVWCMFLYECRYMSDCSVNIEVFICCMYIVVDSLFHVLSCTFVILDHQFRGIFSWNEMLLFLACSILQDNIHLYCAISTLWCLVAWIDFCRLQPMNLRHKW